jgi:hypothetical protein
VYSGVAEAVAAKGRPTNPAKARPAAPAPACFKKSRRGKRSILPPRKNGLKINETAFGSYLFITPNPKHQKSNKFQRFK